MPPQASVEIPVPSRPITNGTASKGKASVKSSSRGRVYGDEPLPVKPSEEAPEHARIIGRTVDSNGVKYTLKIGEVPIKDVGVEEVLDYVSALDLEEYENHEFEQERVVLKLLDAEKERLEQESVARKKEHAKRKGVVIYQSETDTDQESGGEEEAFGKHGRKRPTYTQFYLKKPPRATTGPSTEEGDDVRDQGAMAPPAPPVSSHHPSERSAAQYEELPKRRRRKRDPVTGELLPLAPLPGESDSWRKRPRRRRHPLTGELMPLGWKFDPDAPSERAAPSPSFRKLSIIDDEPGAKRQKLETESETSRSTTPALTNAEIAASFTTQLPATKPTPSKREVVELLSSEDEADVDGRARSSVLKSFQKPPSSGRKMNMLKPGLSASATATSSEGEAAPQAMATAVKSEVSQLSTSPVKTSIMNPSASQADEPEEESEEEWLVDKILGHSFSDPKTHPTELGKKPVILYQVKWHGFAQPTWEPIDSFGDLGVVNAYRKRAGLPLELSDSGTSKEKDSVALPNRSLSPSKTMNAGKPSGASQKVSATDPAPEYEVERITAHHLSDPRTHPPGLGKKPVMLYQVKWKGYRDMTWEPATSFADKGILNAYNRRNGLPKYEGEDESMEDAA
ncbi:uncharacterized protein LTR77_001908 [Saxophila tyrrhenica]|uniref:Chromo domain-containing protein n=1 Tax=Saxophila tyrrhenica TaxID=1690608 RepID=A0AAV9PM24_9PEZI|nr:hypothetical protein LTR77_001908 [Saxophila tyrrhenica]